MLLTITTTYNPATDLGYLLHKHPDRFQAFPLAYGKAHVFFPVKQVDRCTAVLLLDIDPIGLVRKRGNRQDARFSLMQYVNDRPYVASSFMSVAIAKVFGTALSGRSQDRPELVETHLPLEVMLTAVPDSSNGDLLKCLFEPLGYEITLQSFPLDEHFPAWGQSNYFNLNLKAKARLADLLAHLYVLIPVLDDQKHYWVGEDEVEKLLKRGEGWLADHPEKELITRRYLKYQSSLTESALSQLVADEILNLEETDSARAAEEVALEKPLSLHQERLQQVYATLKSNGAKSVIDLGCGEGKLIELLLADRGFTKITGMDVSFRALQVANSRLKIGRLPPTQQERINLMHGSLMYRDSRLAGYDAATVVEVIEHFDPPRLDAFERVLFQHARPGLVVITTPNVEYNQKFPSLPAGSYRHQDHRFEWTRAEFTSWADSVADRFGYSVSFQPVGPEDDSIGAPGQMGVFTR